MDGKSVDKTLQAPHSKTKRRSTFTWLIFALLLAAVVLFGYHVLMDRLNGEIRLRVTAILRKNYPHMSVSVGRAILDPGKALVLDSVTLALPTKDTHRRVFTIGRLIGRGPIDLSDLVRQQLPIERWEIQGLEISVWPNEGSWSIQSLLPLPKLASSDAQLVITQGIVRIEGAAGSEEELVLHDLQMNISSMMIDDPNLTSGVGNDIVTKEGSARPKRKLLTVRNGRLSSSFFRGIQFEGSWDPSGQSWSLKGQVESLDYSASLRKRLPAEVTVYLQQLAGLNCQVDAVFSVRRDSPSEKPRFECGGRIADGRLIDDRLPYQLDQLCGKFYVDNRCLQLREMDAQSGKARFRLESDIFGFGGDSPLKLHAIATDLEFDDRLYRALPEKLRRQWDRFQVHGRVNAEVNLDFDGKRWEPRVEVDCQDVAVRFSEFPYPVDRIKGRIIFEQSRLYTPERIHAFAGGQPAQGALDITLHPGVWTGFTEFAVDGTIPIDDTLVSSLSPRTDSNSRDSNNITSCERFVRSLHPAGSVHVKRARFERERIDSPELKKQIELNLYGCSIRFDSFRYPIYDIQGTIVADDTNWRIEQTVGRNDTARISCDGTWQTIASEIHNLALHFEATSVPLEDELHRALPEEVGSLWTQLQPRGTLDRVNIGYERPTPDRTADLHVTISKNKGASDSLNSQVSLHPIVIPYLLQDVACELDYQQGVLKIISASGRHGSSHIETEGVVNQLPTGWVADLKLLPSTRLQFESDLVNALPPRLREPLRQADFRGPVHMLGTTRIGPFSNAATTPDTEWDLELDMEDAQLRDGETVSGIRGTMRLKGKSDSSGPAADGYIALDAMTIMGVPVTTIRGPVAVRGSQLLLGRKAAETIGNNLGENSTYVADIAADVLGGKVNLAGIGSMETSRLEIDAQLVGGDLQTALQELGDSATDSRGICNATVRLRGSPFNPQTLSGDGKLEIRDASLYQLPAMMRLLRFLSIGPPKEGAFESADVTFRIDGDRIPIERLAIDGDMLSLRGSGWANLRREVNLDLYAFMGNRGRLATLLSPVLSQTRFAPLMRVQVEGTLDAPEMQRKPPPVIEDALEQFFPEGMEQQRNQGLGILPRMAPAIRTASKE